MVISSPFASFNLSSIVVADTPRVTSISSAELLAVTRNT